ncbi:MAG: family 16 glycosylhydrolase [Cyclobacteriaceae bacterium]|nr:family 16 glycosylhydrolase [Cyclobacteriaceae bacterium]
MTKTSIIITFWMLAGLGFITCSSSSEDPPAGNTPELFISNVTFSEGTSGTNSVNVNFNLTAASQQSVSVSYNTEDGSAKATEDYETTSGTLTIDAGQTQKTLSINFTTDDILEFDETFDLVLSNVQNATITISKIAITILDDDSYQPAEDDDGFITPDSYPSMDLVWSEEFDDATLNEDDWNYELGDGCPDLCGWGNNELQSYTEENTELSDGKLEITAEENMAAPNFTSSRITTKGKQEFQYGRIDIRAKLPKGQGIWPAIWMLGSNIDQVGWPVCGEIDIMEMVGHEPFRVHGTAHYDNNGHNFTGSPYSIPETETFGDKYHIFTILWQEGSIQWFVDYQPFFSISRSQIGATYPFNANFFFIANIAVGGNWPGNPDGTTVFPQVMEVDYIRVFQTPGM